MKKKYLYTLNIIYRGSHSPLGYSIDKSTLIDFELLSKLCLLGIVVSFYKIDKSRLLVLYNKKQRNYNIKSILSSKFQQRISLKEIFKLVKNNGGFYYLILTKYGLLTHKEAFDRKVGGRVLFVVSK